MDTKSRTKKDEPFNYFWFAFSEIAFVFLPFVAIFIAFYSKKIPGGIIKEHEWSLTASVMFGQSIVKLIYAFGKIVNMKGKILLNKFIGFISLIILVGLVPSLVILTLMIITDKPEQWLIQTQIGLFIGGVTVFFATNWFLAKADNARDE